MRISVIQSDIKWENKHRNFRSYEKTFSSLPETDIILLPEMFTTGFTPHSSSQGEGPRGETHEWMTEMSRRYNTGICGSYIVIEGSSCFNRWVFVSPDGKTRHYDKRHLFKMNNVENDFTPGRKRLVFTFRGFRICPNICYDLRFPVWSRNRNDYDLLINAANWPSARRDVWLTLLRARAIENLCFVAGINRIGIDGAGIKYNGDSLILGPKGEKIAGAGKDRACTITADLSLPALKAFRKKFPAHLDADNFSLSL
ncbi:MAG: amidohydrolase [Bacteroidales bacterium]|jgi:predicted amidohydrolase|nr:amidohydrolase [Bacteroidales bacterium]